MSQLAPPVTICKVDKLAFFELSLLSIAKALQSLGISAPVVGPEFQVHLLCTARCHQPTQRRRFGLADMCCKELQQLFLAAKVPPIPALNSIEHA